MPITIQNSAGGGVTLDSTTSSNETLQLPSGGGTLAPLASPSFTGNVGIGTSSPATPLDVTKAGGGNFVANFQNTTAATPYGVQIKDAASGANDYPLFQVTNSAGSTAHLKVMSGTGHVLFGCPSVPTSSVHGAGFVADNSHELRLSASGTGNTTRLRFLNPNGEVGSIRTSGSATAFNTSSDYRLKENVTPMSGATAQTKLLKPCNFDWIAGGNVNGFLAHELAEVVPEAVTGTKDAMRDEEYEVTPATDTEAAVMGTRSVPDMQGIDQAKLVPLLTATIQELIARIEALENV